VRPAKGAIADRHVPLATPHRRGVNVTWTVQLAPALRLLPQVLVSLKSPGLTPAIPMEKIAIGALPALVSVTVRAVLEVPTGRFPMYRLRGDHWKKVARPVSGTVCGLPIAVSVIETEAVRTPCAVGVNVIVMRQLAPDATLVEQLFDWAKS
jgi:hypothetical protein